MSAARARPTASQAWREYFEGSSLLENELDRRLKDAADMDLGEFNILLVLFESEDKRMRMGDLARAIAFAPGRLTYRIAALERAGLVRREQSTTDRRGTEAVLTDAGSRRLRKARPVHARHVEELFLGGLDDEAIAVLHRVFGPLRAGLLGRSAAGAEAGADAAE